MRLLFTVALLGLAACSREPEKISINFDDLPPLTAKEEADFAAQKKLIDRRWNENANAVNARMKEYYDRGVAACANLRKAGHPDGNGCPRPKPNYLEIRK